MLLRTSKPYKKVKTITYHYPNGDIKHIEFKNVLTIREAGWELSELDTSDIEKGYLLDNTDDNRYINIPENIRRSNLRAIAKIEHYTHANNFEYFVTLTYDPSVANEIGLDISNINDTMLFLSKWIEKQRKMYGKFDYIFVPERHKNGNIHWHGVIKGYKGHFRHFGMYKGHDTFVLKDWITIGHNTCSVINNLAKTSNYLSKYISKSIDLEMLGKRRYLVSKGLQKPIVVYNDFIDTTDMLTYDNNHCDVFYTNYIDKE